MSKKQPTLFEAWNKTSYTQDRSNSAVIQRNISRSTYNDDFNNIASPNEFQTPTHTRTNDLADPEFDYEAGKTWIYPTNYPVRDYQFSIVKEALFRNTLVVLPTGLGKTFIAAVVMYNIYRWYPNGKVVFMAPTRPLVAQQVDACFKITGISQEDTTQMTGTNAPDVRKRLWLKKRVFFLTPQVLVNDLVRNICPAGTIKCLVVDEAHKALGNFAYCQVIKELCNHTLHFRVLALTATPGSETQAVKQVLCNLLISHVEIRSEDSEDVQEYTHIRDVEKIVVPLGDRLNTVKSKFLDVINLYLKRLTLRKVMTAKNPASLSKFQILKLREMFSQHPPASIDRMTYGLAMADFSLCISLYHAYELLLLHGATSFYNFLNGILNGDKSIPHARSELLKNFEFEEIMKEVKKNYIPDPKISNLEGESLQNIQRRILPGHPKLEKLLDVVLNHFKVANRENITDTRVMIFTQYRDSVQEIVDMLHEYQPIVKVMSFVGQSSKSATSIGVSQKQQLKVIYQFRNGGYNTLVSTCVGEEGLDIGEVDLIVCYDCPKSPIRLVQRMGRTGRLRKGRIIILITEGKEEQMYNSCEYRKKTVHRAITKGFSFAQFYQSSPSLIPPGVKPVCVKTTVTIAPKKIVLKPSTVSKSPYLTEEEMAEFEQHVKTSRNHVPLLPKSECIVLKNSLEKGIEDEPAGASSEKSLFSLSKWTLWQTTPQRTHFFPHSSKSLLLPKILEHIHFPELIWSRNTTLNFSNLPDSPKNVGLKEEPDHFQTSFRQSKITDLLSTSKIVNDVKGDFVEVISSSEKEIYEITSPISKPVKVNTRLPLMQLLFDICMPKCNTFPHSDLKAPPITVSLPDIADFSSVVIENVAHVQDKSYSILRVLNKRMKAKIKRKSKELDRKICFSSDCRKSTSPARNVSDTLSEVINDDIGFDVSFDIPCFEDGAKPIYEKSNIKYEEHELKGVSFDLDFDFPGEIDNDLQSKYNADAILHTHLNLSKSENNPFEFDVNISPEKGISSDSKKNIELNLSNKCNYSEVGESQNKVSNMHNFKFDLNSQNIQNSSEILTNKNITVEPSKSFYAIKNSQTALKKLYVPKECVSDLSCIKSKDNSLNLELTSSASCPQNKHKLDSLLDSDVNLNGTDSFKILLSKGKLNDIDCNLDISSYSDKSEPPLSDNVNNIHVINGLDRTITVNKKLVESPINSKNIVPNPSCINKENESSIIKNAKENNSGELNINFDVSFSVWNNEEKTQPKNSCNLPDIPADKTKENSMSKDVDIASNLDEFDKDANSIVEQIFINQKNISTNMNCSFSSSPLTVKRCIAEIEVDKKQILTNPQKCIKLSKDTLKSSDIPSNNLFKAPDARKDISFTKSKFCSKEDYSKSLNIEEASQYSMTQLLSLIDATGDLERKSRNSPEVLHKAFQKQFDVIDVSSEDEVCPTPPKEVIKTKSKFIYSNKIPVRKSFSFQNSEKIVDNYVNRQTTILNANNAICAPFPTLMSKLPNDQNISLNDSLEMSDKSKRFHTLYSVSKEKSCENITPSSANKDNNTLNKTTFNDLEFEQLYKLTFDVSFDLPFTQENLNISVQDNSIDMNNAICVKSLSNEIKLHENFDENYLVQKNALTHESKISEDFNSDTNVSKRLCNTNCVTHELTFDDSESLLPAKQMTSSKLMSEDISFSSFSSKLANNKLVEQNIDNATRDCTAEQSINLCSASSNKVEENCFENSFFFELLSPKISVSESEIEDLKSMPNDKKDENGLSQIINNKINLAHKEKIGDSKLNLVADQAKLFQFHQTSNLLHFDDKPEFIKCNLHPSVSEKKLVFDLCDDDETCDLLISRIAPEIASKKLEKNCMLPIKNNDSQISCENFGSSEDFLLTKSKVTVKNIEMVSTTSAFTSNDKKEMNLLTKNCLKSNLEKLGIEDFLSSKPKRVAEHIEDSKKVSENTFFKSSKSKGLCLEKNLNSLNEENHSNLWEFDQNGKQIYMQEINKNEDIPEFFKDEDLTACNPLSEKIISKNELGGSSVEQSTMKKRFSKLSKIYFKSSNIISDKWSDRHEISVIQKDQPCSSKDKLNKLSSKLNVKYQTKSLTKNILKGGNFIEEDEEDFQFIRKIEKKANECGNPKSKRKKTSNRNEFLLSQAEVSGGEDSDCESDLDDDNALEKSFINDESPKKMSYTDQHAFYLRSLKDSVGFPKQFKLKALDKNYYRYLPEPEGECSNYMLDSFCVKDDEVAFLSSDDELIPHKSSKNSHKRSKNAKKSSKRLKRVVMHDSSTSSEHGESPKGRKENTEVTCINNLPFVSLDESVIAVKKHKSKFVISSDEDDKFVFMKPLTVESRRKIEKTVPNISNASFSKDPDTTQKFEFSLDFGENNIEFMPLSITKETKADISMTLISKENGCVDRTSEVLNIPSTSTSKGILSTDKSMATASHEKFSSKSLSCDLNSKSSEYTLKADLDAANVSFDIGWDEFSPCDFIDARIMKNTVPNENINSEPSNERKCTKALDVLVDSRELASGKPVISALRSLHNMNPVIMQLNSADYIISNRVAIERVLNSEFSNCAMPPKIVNKIKSMNEIYEKSIVIIEQDNRKHVLSFNKNTTKCLQFVLCLNYHPSTRVLFSKSVENTSELISQLVLQEKKRGYHITVPVTLSPKTQKLYDFYTSFPKVSPICALNFIYYFPTIESFSKCSVEDLEKKGCIPSQKAVKIFKYFRSELTYHENL